MNNKIVKDIIKKVNKNAYIIPVFLAIFCVPIFWNPSFIYSFTQGKEILFKILMLLSLFGIGVFILKNKGIKVKEIFKSTLFLILLLQLLIYSITNTLSDHSIIAFHGTYSRGGGGIMSLFLFFFLIYISLFLSKKNLKSAGKVFFASSLIIAIYAISQKMGWDIFFKNYGTNIFDGRSFSFSGNPSYLGQLMLLSAILGILLLSITKKKTKKAIYASGSIIFLLTIILSGTRAAILGLIVVIALLAIKYIKPIYAFIKRHKAVSICALVIGILIFANLPQDRYSFSALSTRSLQSRFEIWEGTTRLIKEKPFFGYGEETFYIYFHEIITKNFLTLEENINLSADRVHNETLETFYNHGIFGVLLYLILIIYIIKIFFKSKDKLTIALALIIIANLAQNQFGFPDMTINMVMAFCFGGLVSLESSNKKKLILLRGWKRITAGVVIFLIVAYAGWGHVYKPYLSQLAYAESKRNYSISYEIAINKHKEAISYTPYYSELLYELMIIDPSSMGRALWYLEILEGESGNVLAWKGNFYAQEDPRKASGFYIRALEKNPYHPNWIRAFADMLYEQEDYLSALFMYNKYLEAVPDFWKWTSEMDKYSDIERQSYKTFFKNTPYFWGILEKMENAKSFIDDNSTP